MTCSLCRSSPLSMAIVCRGGKGTYEELTGCLNQLMPFVYVAFFGLAGASLKLVSHASETA